MPKGVPVATFAIGDGGAANAALFAVAMLAVNDAALRGKLDAYRAKQTEAARAMTLRSSSMKPLLPGATGPDGRPVTLGVMGGGQLGRMFVQAAQAMGYFTAVLDPDKTSPAGLVAPLPHRRPTTSTSRAWRN